MNLCLICIQMTYELLFPLKTEYYLFIQLHNFVAFAMSHNMRVVKTYFEKAETQDNTQEWSSRVTLITFCAEAVTRVTLKTVKLSWVKV